MIGRWFGNYQTTLIGLAGGVLNQVANGMSWQSASMSAFIILLGLFAKDAQTGSRPGAGS